MKPTIAFTGGHHNSALEVAKALKKEGYPIIWIGHKFTSRGDKSLSAEYQEVVSNNIKFLELKTGKFYRHRDPMEYLKIPLGFLQSLIYLVKYRPSLIFASGGYLAVPVVIVGRLLGIRSITHEQTVISGWANKAISPFVEKILLTHQSSINNFPKNKSIVVGLPLRKEFFNSKYQKKFSPKLLFITCGKQGSHVINQAIFPLIPELVKDYTVVHQTGANTIYKDQDKARRIKDKLGSLKDRYIHSPYFFTEDMATYLKSANIIISRAGAHLTYELMVLNKKAILIPIPWVSHNEQFLNASLAAEYTGSEIVEEKDLSSANILQAIHKLEKKSKSKIPAKLSTNATEKIIEIIHQYI